MLFGYVVPGDGGPERSPAPGLRRDRLLRWLEERSEQRLLLVTAGPGFGKTAFLEDLCRAASVPTFWLRVAFIHREAPAFARGIVATLSRTRAEESGLSDDADVRRLTGACLDAIAALPEQRGLLVLDDFHVADDVPAIRSIVRDLVAEAPAGFALAIGSRRRPALPLARFRAGGEVVELGPEHLRFGEDEAARLLGSLGTDVAPEVAAGICHETGGWPAAVHLVGTAVREIVPVDPSVGRCPARALAVAKADLHAYLAEEVAASLPPALRRFALATALLDDVTVELGAAVAEIPVAEAERAVEELWTSGLLASPQEHQGSGYRYRPIVRDYLETELRGSLTAAEIEAAHRRAAAVASAGEWRAAVRHLVAAHAMEEAVHLICGRLSAILDRGEASACLPLIREADIAVPDAVGHLLRSRSAFLLGSGDEALAEAIAARGSEDRGAELRPLIEENLAIVHRARGDESASPPTPGPVVDAVDVRTADRALADLVPSLPPSPSHRRATLILAAAVVSLLRGDASTAAARAAAAASDLRQCGAPRELAHALAVWGWALADAGRWPEAIERLADATAAGDDDAKSLAVVAAIQRAFGAPGEARLLAARRATGDGAETARVADLGDVCRSVGRLTGVSVLETAATAIAGALGAIGSPDAAEMAAAAIADGTRGGARWCADIGRLALGLALGGIALSDAVVEAGQVRPSAILVLSDPISHRLHELEPHAAETVARSIAGRPDRWRPLLRRRLADAQRKEARVAAARALEDVGTAEDVDVLHDFAKALHLRGSDAQLGRRLARVLAPPIFFEDLGRVGFAIAGAEHAGTSVRRKVLALICFLITRPDLSATRDQVLDALWPEQDPEVAGNSLNQTLYYLRQGLDRAFADDRSPEYVHHDSEVVWLDPELVLTRSRRCRDLIRGCRAAADPAIVDELSVAYTGRFALDFSYEPWAEAYRESLHAAYLEVIERAVRQASSPASGDAARAISLARRALEVDPDAEELELALLTLYRRTGAHAAAAEQYAHYASVMRDTLGVEPPALDSL